MPRLTRTIHCLAADDRGNLACATVADSPLGVRAKTTEPIASALEMPADQLASRLPKLNARDALVFVCPSSLASLRPFALTASGWAGAKEDVIASVGTLFPLTTDDARVGLFDLARDDSDEGPAQGVLVGVSAQTLRPWLEHIRAATGHAPSAVLAPAQCLPALGLQEHAHARVFEAVGLGETVQHTLHHGEPARVSETPSSDTTPHDHRLPGVPADEAPGAKQIALTDLAIAGALTPTLAKSRTAPVQGALPAPRSRWLLPAACLLLACALGWFALEAPERRTAAALETIDAKARAIEPDADRVARIRREALTLNALLDNAIAPTLNGWTPALPDLDAARAALPEGVWLYEIQLTPRGIDITGVAPDPREVLRAIESSPAFSGASFVNPPAPIPSHEGEQFHLTATRTSLTGGGP